MKPLDIATTAIQTTTTLVLRLLLTVLLLLVGFGLGVTYSADLQAKAKEIAREEFRGALEDVCGDLRP